MVKIHHIWYWMYSNAIRLALFIYFKKITVKGAEQIPKTGPILFISNHQNALLDSLVLGIHCGKKVHFLARADLFNKSIVAFILKSLQMIPIYRIRNGRNALAKNNTTFDRCQDLLSQQKEILIFPEGNHSLKRRVRPLSKGFTRIVFRALSKDIKTPFYIVPVGQNYQNASKYPDQVLVNFGKPILANPYFNKDDINASTKNLVKACSAALAQLTTHIPPEKDYQKTIKQLDQHKTNYLFPEQINAFFEHKNLKEIPQTNPHKPLGVFLRFAGKLSLFPIWLLWRFAIKPNIKQAEFIATFRFGILFFLTPIWILIISLILIKLDHQIAVMYLMAQFAILCSMSKF